MRLSILSVSKAAEYLLTKPFIRSMQLALTGGGNHRSFGVPCNSGQSERVPISQLDEFARQRWESVLGYMVGSAEGVVIMTKKDSVNESVKKLLKNGGLVRSGGKATITKEGFAFVLQEVNQQVWIILIHYLGLCDETNMNPTEVLSFFFTLSSLELGQDYSKNHLTPTQLHVLDDLADFGLVYQPPNSARFYPTRLATTLTASDALALRNSSATGAQPAPLTSDDTKPDAGFIIIETNYRIYAYTRSTLQIAILQLFAKLRTRYPNMVAGKITRASIRRAVALGITSEQIITFLSAHAHPQMRKGGRGDAGGGTGAGPQSDATVLPPTVVDQIRLWQIEGERMKASPGYLFKDFASDHDFEKARRYADEMGVLVWNSPDKRMLFVTKLNPMGSFVQNLPKKAA